MNMSIFRRSRIVVVSQSNRSCDISISYMITYIIHNTLHIFYFNLLLIFSLTK